MGPWFITWEAQTTKCIPEADRSPPSQGRGELLGVMLLLRPVSLGLSITCFMTANKLDFMVRKKKLFCILLWG